MTGWRYLILRKLFKSQTVQLCTIKNPTSKTDWVFIINMAATYSPSVMRVPSAMGDLTSLFGMGRGEHPRQNHHKILKAEGLNVER